MNDSLADLFPDGDYRFHLTLRRSTPGDFFRPRDPTGQILRERTRWLTEKPERYAALLPEGEPVAREFSVSVEGLNVTNDSPPELMRKLGASLEPDVLFLSPDPDGRFRLRGGALCFPTGWALEEKLGHTLDFIHGVVPGLNPAIGGAIHQFLSKMKPGIAFLRDNWGLAATDDLNLHPARRIPPPVSPVRLERLWLRVEHQALMILPETRGLVFGIRIALHRLDQLIGSPAAAGLKRGLATMPAELAAYKRLDHLRDQVIAQL